MCSLLESLVSRKKIFFSTFFFLKITVISFTVIETELRVIGNFVGSPEESFVELSGFKTKQNMKTYKKYPITAILAFPYLIKILQEIAVG